MMQRAASFLSGILRQASRDEEASLVFLAELWPRIVGRQVAQKTRPVALRSKTLLLTVPSDTWCRHLGELRGMMIRSINEFWGEPLVKRINFRVDTPDGHQSEHGE